MSEQSVSAFDTLVADALTHHRAGRLAEADAAYRAALEIAPGRPALTHNLGVIAAARAEHETALVHFDQAIAAEPRYASAHYNRGVALQALGRTRDAITALACAAAIEPEHYDAHRALGFLYLAAGNRGRSLDHFARTYELRRGEDRSGAAQASLTYANRTKLAHDAEQLSYIASRKRDGRRFEVLARAYLAVARDLPADITALSDTQLEMLGWDYNTAIHVAAAPELPGPAVARDLTEAAILNDHLRRLEAGATWIDHLLTPPALAALRRYLLESTIWHDFSHIGGFVASYLEDGLACPLLLQIADELRAAVPTLLGAHPLTQAWAFKGVDGASAVAAHADDAAFTVNLWLTPDEANLDPAGGGLTICLTPPPPAWQMRDYDADTEQVQTFMDRNRASLLAVPYRDNRAVVFDSRLFHRSDAPNFAAGYPNHRINLTLLFGRHRP